ncbi:MAG: hypothetical protein ACLPSW_04285 [Roseiarcus sp.]|jgi:hypothetical protein
MIDGDRKLCFEGRSAGAGAEAAARSRKSAGEAAPSELPGRGRG